MNQDTAYDATRAESGITGNAIPIYISEKTQASPARKYDPGHAGCSGFKVRITKTPGTGFAPLLNTGLCS